MSTARRAKGPSSRSNFRIIREGPIDRLTKDLHFSGPSTSDIYNGCLYSASSTHTKTMTSNPIIPAIALGLLLPNVGFSRPQGPPPSPVVEALDKDRDRELSSREIKNASKALLKLDEDDDNALSAEEIRPEPPRGERRRNRDDADAERPPGPPPSELIKAIDADGSGDLSEAEIAGASEALLKLDSDEDGELSTEEAGLGRPGGPGGQGGPPPGGQGGPPPRGPQR